MLTITTETIKKIVSACSLAYSNATKYINGDNNMSYQITLTSDDNSDTSENTSLATMIGNTFEQHKFMRRMTLVVMLLFTAFALYAIISVYMISGKVDAEMAHVFYSLLAADTLYITYYTHTRTNEISTSGLTIHVNNEKQE